jgi:hypothetical protein
MKLDMNELRGRNKMIVTLKDKKKFYEEEIAFATEMKEKAKEVIERLPEVAPDAFKTEIISWHEHFTYEEAMFHHLLLGITAHLKCIEGDTNELHATND